MSPNRKICYFLCVSAIVIFVGSTSADDLTDDAVGYVEGQIYDSETVTPLESVNVTIVEDSENETSITTVRTSSDGYYRIVPKRMGNKQILISRSGFSPVRLSVEIASSSERMDLALLKAASVTGIVTDSTSRPVADAHVELNYVQGVEFAWVIDTVGGRLETQVDGEFWLRNIEAYRDFRLIITHADHQTYVSDTITLGPGQKITLNAVLPQRAQ